MLVRTYYTTDKDLGEPGFELGQRVSRFVSCKLEHYDESSPIGAPYAVLFIVTAGQGYRVVVNSAPAGTSGNEVVFVRNDAHDAPLTWRVSIGGGKAADGVKELAAFVEEFVDQIDSAEKYRVRELDLSSLVYGTLAKVGSEE